MNHFQEEIKHAINLTVELLKFGFESIKVVNQLVEMEMSSECED